MGRVVRAGWEGCVPSAILEGTSAAFMGQGLNSLTSHSPSSNPPHSFYVLRTHLVHHYVHESGGGPSHPSGQGCSAQQEARQGGSRGGRGKVPGECIYEPQWDGTRVLCQKPCLYSASRQGRRSWSLMSGSRTGWLTASARNWAFGYRFKH